MRIAISTEGDFVSAHFGRCPFFTIVNIENGIIAKKDVVENPGHELGLIPKFLHQKGVECIVCGGMGMRAVGFFNEYGIQTIVGISGRIDEVIEKIKKNALESAESLCNPGAGKGYGLDKTQCDHSNPDEHKN
ncbi:MAG: NifB/NifX family molybdenum-iron cluster-binding protein [Bacteroidetes bacterium]|nr:NifB/NifX family molybdenum-iron cluster-binding protein [Bacteroidota bacterium]